MEQKRTLWIVAAAGVFLLVVVGAALIIFAPQTSYAPESGFNSTAVSTPAPAYGTQNTVPRSPFDGTPSYPVTDTPAFDVTATAPAQEAPVQTAVPGEIRTDNVTVYAGTTNVYGVPPVSAPPSPVPPVTYDFDLNNLRAPKGNDAPPAVEPKNAYTSGQIADASAKKDAKSKPADDDSYYAPAPASKPAEKPAVKPASKPAVTSAAPAKKAPPKKETKKAATPKTPDRFWVQAASYTNKKSADEARTVLETNKIPSEVFTYTDAKGKVFYRVRVGPYTTSSEAEYWQKRVAMIDQFASTPSYVVNSSAKAN